MSAAACARAHDHHQGATHPGCLFGAVLCSGTLQMHALVRRLPSCGLIYDKSLCLDVFACAGRAQRSGLPPTKACVILKDLNADAHPLRLSASCRHVNISLMSTLFPLSDDWPWDIALRARPASARHQRSTAATTPNCCVAASRHHGGATRAANIRGRV
jgi:hypothetical protein